MSNVNACTLLFTDAGLEIFDGSRSTWDSNANGNFLQRLDLIDAGDMQIRDKEGNLAWKASDNPVINQNCGSIGSPGLAPETPPFATPIEQDTPFGQNQQQQPQLGVSQQGLNQPISALNQPISALNQPISALNQPFSSLNQPLGGSSGQHDLVDNTPYDSGAKEEKKLSLIAFLVSVMCLMAGFGFPM